MALTKVPSNLDSVTATTQSQGDGSTNVATTAYVDTGLANLIDSAPGNLNTLNELAAAMNDNASFFSTVLPLSGGTMTGHILLNNAVELRSKDTGGTTRTITRINSSNELEYGYSGSGPVKFMGGGAYTERMRIHTDGNIGIGTTSPTGKLEIAKTGTNAAPHIKLVESGDTREFNIYNDGSGNGHLVLADSDDDTPDTEIVLNDNGIITMLTGNSERIRIDSSGHTTPGADNAQDLGTNSKRWRNIYSADLQLSNVDTGGNDVDGSEGSWTIQEGENDLFIINRKNGKKYKFNLEEVE